MEHRRGARGLEANHGRQARGFPGLSKLAIARPVSGDVSGIPKREQMEVRRVSQVVHDFESGRFLSGDPVGVDRVHDREIIAPSQRTNNKQGVVEVAIDRDNFRAVGESLHQLTARDLAGGQDDGAANPRARGVRGRGSRSIAGRSADHRGGALGDGLGNRDRSFHGP